MGRRVGSAVVAGALLVSLVAPALSARGATSTPIMGRSALVADQLVAWYRSTGRTPRLADVSLSDLARLFVEEGYREGVRGDIAFAQSMLETGYLAFSDTVPPRYHNYAGIGAPDDTAKFPDARTGVRAQIQHLRAYADPTVDRTGTASPLVDPRFDRVNPKGQAPTFEDLGGRWSSGADYGVNIVSIYHRILDFAGPQLAAAGLGVDVVGMGTGPRGGAAFLGSDGGVFALGGLPFRGSLYSVLGSTTDVRATAIATTSTGNGYSVLTDDGGIFAFGDAVFRGSAHPFLEHSTVRATAIATTSTGNGYYVLTDDGGIFAFGDAVYRGSPHELVARGVVPRVRFVGIAVDGSGYVVAGQGGGVYTFATSFRGSAGGELFGTHAVAIEPITGGGYRLVTADGGAIAYV